MRGRWLPAACVQAGEDAWRAGARGGAVADAANASGGVLGAGARREAPWGVRR
ncbi:MAG TPA: hypothetical protein K8V16_07375 [Rubneribacter badeniensis]|uniref:Uncharacterized protein n=1 Tax=Rubneribacter badeniensis TaxID=2070688 RepID=A0A9D2VLB6_9ACTN|nr:hypothetical protein [Rubneribacter badeniensis]